jgi:hypothetical protein
VCARRRQVLRREGTGPEVEATPEALAQAVDATLDEAVALLAGVDTSTLPAEVAQAIALLVAADNTVDELLTVMGSPDPDEEPDTADEAAGAAADAAAPAAKSAVTPPDVLARLPSLRTRPGSRSASRPPLPPNLLNP